MGFTSKLLIMKNAIKVMEKAKSYFNLPADCYRKNGVKN